jgi:hypothetical protein
VRTLVPLQFFAAVAHNSYTASITCSFKKSAKKVPGKAGLRFWKNVGLGFKTPKEAIEGNAILYTGTPMHCACHGHQPRVVIRNIHRQEVPVHRQRVYPWPSAYWYGYHNRSLSFALGLIAAAWSTGVVRSTKMNRTIVVRRDYLHFIKKYGRYGLAAVMMQGWCSLWQ